MLRPVEGHSRPAAGRPSIVPFFVVLSGACGALAGDGNAVIRHRIEGAGAYEFERTAPELLAEPDESNVAVVELRVTDVSEGVGMSWDVTAEDQERRTLLPFDAGDAMARSAHLRAEVVRVLSRPSDWPVSAGDDISFGIAIDATGEIAALRHTFEGEMFVGFLVHSPVFDYEPDLLAVVVDGGLLCRRSGDTGIDCPALPSDVGANLDIGGVVISPAA